jgi:5-methylcytosine-specific restriction protein A
VAERLRALLRLWGVVKTIGGRLGSVAGSRLRPPPKQVDPHYRTDEHKAWAAAVMRRAGYRCQAPGCRKAAPEHRLFADHVTEMRDGGAPFDPANGQALCGMHHSAKTAAERVRRLKG